MSTYVIGDIHGCNRTLKALLDQIGFKPHADRLWLTGDLVNGGPESLTVLRWAKALDENVVAVLGNHDLYFLARVLGVCDKKRNDTLDPLLSAGDVHELADWLRCRPLIHCRDQALLVHAGLLPQWDVPTAIALAREVEADLRSDRIKGLLRSSFAKQRKSWKPDLKGNQRHAIILQSLTSLRTCKKNGAICRRYSGPPETAPSGCLPWYERRPPGIREPVYYFGHWAALGFRRLPIGFALDSGCRWGSCLTAVRLQDGAIFQQPNQDL